MSGQGAVRVLETVAELRRLGVPEDALQPIIEWHGQRKGSVPEERAPWRLCAEYDNVAIVQRTDDAPRWLKQPAKVHIDAGLMLDDEASTFITNAYSVTQGCESGVLHGELLGAACTDRSVGGLTAADREALNERIWSKIEKTETCWLWTGRLQNGYGRIQIGGRGLQVHRAVWELLRGPIEAGLQIDHLCRVRNCCNPEHLQPVTPQVNVLRSLGPTADNARKTHCIYGHPLSGDNLRIDSKGSRECRECRRRRRREAHARERFARLLRPVPPADETEPQAGAGGVGGGGL